MADINITLAQNPVVHATLSNTPAINATLSNTPAINATLSNTPAINATLSNTPAINVTLNGSGAPGAASADVLTLTAGEPIAARDLIYRAADGKVYRASNASGTQEATGYTLAAIATNATGLCYFGNGVIGGFTGLTANARIFLTSTPGSFAYTTGSGVIVQQVGRTLSDTQIIFEPQSPIGQN